MFVTDGGVQGFPQLGEDEYNAHLADGITRPVPPKVQRPRLRRKNWKHTFGTDRCCNTQLPSQLEGLSRDAAGFAPGRGHSPLQDLSSCRLSKSGVVHPT